MSTTPIAGGYQSGDYGYLPELHWNALRDALRLKLRCLNDDELINGPSDFELGTRIKTEGGCKTAPLSKWPTEILLKNPSLDESKLFKIVRSLCVTGLDAPLSECVFRELQALTGANARKLASICKLKNRDRQMFPSNFEFMKAVAIHWGWFISGAKFVERIFAHLNSCRIDVDQKTSIKRFCFREYRKVFDMTFPPGAKMISSALTECLNTIRESEWPFGYLSDQNKINKINKTDEVEDVIMKEVGDVDGDDDRENDFDKIYNSDLLTEENFDKKMKNWSATAVVDCLIQLEYYHSTFINSFNSNSRLLNISEFDKIFASTKSPIVIVNHMMRRIANEINRAKLYLHPDSYTKLIQETLSSVVGKRFQELFTADGSFLKELFIKDTKLQKIKFLSFSVSLLGEFSKWIAAWDIVIQSEVQNILSSLLSSPASASGIVSLISLVKRFLKVASECVPLSDRTKKSEIKNKNSFFLESQNDNLEETADMSEIGNEQFENNQQKNKISEEEIPEIVFSILKELQKKSQKSFSYDQQLAIQQTKSQISSVLNSIPSCGVWICKALNLLLHKILSGQEPSTFKTISQKYEIEVDGQTKSKIIDENKTEKMLIQSLGLFRLVDTKEPFVNLFQNSFVKRFRFASKSLQRLEVTFVKLLSEECGSHFTSKIYEIIDETNMSRSLSLKFLKSDSFNEVIHPAESSTLSILSPDLTVEVSVISRTLWPSAEVSVSSETIKSEKKDEKLIIEKFDIPNLIIPPQLDQLLIAYEALYAESNKKRLFTWLLKETRCSLSAKYVRQDNHTDEYVMSTSGLQAVILLLFNENSSLSFSEIQTKTNIPYQSLRNDLGVLSLDPTKKILNVDNDKQFFTINDSFVSTTSNVMLRSVAAHTTSDAEESLESFADIRNERSLLLDAFLVRTVKLKIATSEEQLLIAMKQNPRLSIFNAEFMKERLKSLVEKEFLSPVVNQPGHYMML